jgi:signal transduction histidine kinase
LALRISIGARWTLRYTVFTLLLLGILAAFLYERIEEIILDGARAELFRQTNAITEVLARNPDRLEVVASFIEAEIAGSAPDLRLAVQLVAPDGTELLRRDILAPIEEPLPASEPHRLDGLFYEVTREDQFPYFVLVVPNGHGYTRAVVYSGPFARTIAKIQTVFVSATAVAFLLTAWLGWWLARMGLQPIAQIIESARHITAATTGESLPTRGSGDELDRLSMTLNQMLERIRRGLDRMRRFSADAAHQLRTPLFALRARLEVTLREARSAEEYRRALEETLGDVEGLGEGVSAILRLAESGAGLDPERSRWVALGPLLRSVVEFFRPLAEEKGVRLAPPPIGEATVWGDSIWLHNLFANLVDNAIKYSKPGDSIELSLEEEPGGVAVSIRDSGPGIDPAERERIFDHFYRGREHAAGAGIGLGLTLASEIARAHRGSIELESSGRGATFSVRLPYGPEGSARV